MTTLGGRVVAVSGEDLPAEQMIGFLSFFALTDETRNGARVAREWAKAGLDPKFIPDARQPVDIARTAMSSVRTRRGSGHGTNGGRVEIRSDEIETTRGTTCYQITRAVWDLSAGVIEHEKGMTMCFDGATITTEPLDDWASDAEAMRSIERRVIKHFEDNAATITGEKVRKAVRRTLVDAGAQNLRRGAGGVYFVPRTFSERDDQGVGVRERESKPILDGLTNVLDELYGSQGDFYTIPLANSEGEREMVRKHFTINANERARELYEKAAQRLRTAKGGRAVRSDFINGLIAERRRLLGEVEQFEQLVSVEKSEIEVNLRELSEAIDELEETTTA